jgi:hypothetical protein
VSSLSLEGLSEDLAVANGYLYVAGGTGGLHVVDISNPLSPYRVATVETPGTDWDVTVSGTRAYVSCLSLGLNIVDVSDPVSPQFVGNVDTPGSARGAAVAGNHVYVADYDHGLQVIDVTDPSTPYITGSVGTDGYARGVAAVINFVYIADGAAGLQVVDVSDPHAPFIVGSVDSPYNAYEVVTAGYAYIAAGSAFHIVPLQCDPAQSLQDDGTIQPTLDLTAWPNPSQGGTVIRFANPECGSVCAGIYDISGRSIRSLFDGFLGAGSHTLAWNGRDAEGRPAATGIYLVRITSQKESRTTRLAILR